MIGGFAIGARPVAASRLIVLAAGITFAVAIAGGGAAQAGLVKASAISVAAAGGGGVLAGFQVFSTDLFAVPLPGSRIIADANAVPGFAAPAVATIAIKPVGGLR